MAQRKSGWSMRHPLSFLVIFLVILVGLHVLFPGGVAADAKERYQAFHKQLSSTVSEGERAVETVEDLIADDPDFLRRYDLKEGWTRSLDEALAKLEAVERKDSTVLAPIVERNDSDDEERLVQELRGAQESLQSARQAIESIPQQIRQVAQYKKEAPKRLAEAKAGTVAKAAQLTESSGELPALRVEVEGAATKYPQKKEDLDRRLNAIVSTPATLQSWVEEAEQELAKDLPDYLVVVARLRAIEERGRALDSAIPQLRARLKQLDTSRDQILADMEVARGATKHRHQYRIVEQIGEADPVERTEWKDVSESSFNKHRNHLGMTLSSKPKGLYDEEAQELATPPGYTYVGNPHYGRWERRGGQSFWAFYGQYAFMRSMFGGGSRNISRSDWDSYDSNRRQGKTYYGRNLEYGSEGSITKAKYGSSKYVKSGGYKGSQYQKQTYRSTRSSGGSTTRRRSSSGRSSGFSRGGK